MKAIVRAASLWAMLAVPVFAADATGRLLDCADIADDGERLACFDREAAAARERSAPEAAFGLEARHEDAQDDPVEIRAVLVALDERGNGKRVFTLDNGQVWAEQVASPRPRLETGDPVRIKAGSLGSFRLFGDGKASTRVERVR